MSPKSVLRTLLAVFLVVIPAVAAAVGPQADQIRIGGSGTSLGLMQLLAKAYQKSHPDAKVVVFPSLGSSGGLRALLKGDLDIAICGRPLKESEIRAGGTAREFARTPFVFATAHPKAQKGITTREIERIYGGETASWPDGIRMRVVLRPATDADTELLMELSPRMKGIVKELLSRPGMIFAVTDQDNADALEKTPGAFGATTLSQIITEKRKLHAFALDGVAPTVAAVAKGRYPLVKPLFYVTTSKSSPAARSFVDFLWSPKGRDILTRGGTQVVSGGR